VLGQSFRGANEMEILVGCKKPPQSFGCGAIAQQYSLA
jgi:hypothetical protein